MNILADENIDEQIIETLRKNGHNFLYAGEMSPGISDKVVLSKANKMNALLLTADKDYGDNMNDIVLEGLRAILVGLVFFFFIFKWDTKELRKINGWSYIVAGFALIFFGMLIDITDNFESLNKLIIVGDTKYQAFLEKVIGYLFGFLFLAVGFWKWLPKIIEHDKQTKNELNNAVDQVKVLSGLLPICSSCKKIRDDKGYWNQIESYIHDHSEADFSHSICPECIKKLYPDLKIDTNK